MTQKKRRKVSLEDEKAHAERLWEEAKAARPLNHQRLGWAMLRLNTIDQILIGEDRRDLL